MNTLYSLAISLWQKARTYAVAHKVIASVVGLVVLYGVWHVYGVLTTPPSVTRYVTATVATGTVVATLTETGQVSASQQIALSPKGSGEVTGVYVKPGDSVYAGQIIAQIDATSALQALQNAKLSLQNAELQYGQNTATSTLALNLTVAENNVTTSQIALQKAHDTAYASIASAYSDLGTVMSGLDSALHDSNLSTRSNQQNIDAFSDSVSSHDNDISIYKSSAETTYQTAYDAYTAQLAAYKQTNAAISNDDLLALAKQTYTVSQTVAEAVRNTHDFYDRVSSDYSLYNLDTPASLTTLLSSTNTYTSSVANDMSTSLSNQSALVSAEQSLAQAQNALATAQDGSNAITVQSAALSLQQAKDAVTNAQTTLAGYTVTAPFAGVIGSVAAQRFDQAGSGTTIATLVTRNKTADITVNEVDASKIKAGQKATLTFDALPGVTIAGTVASVDTIGAASQGVVSYDAVISFDTPTTAVLPGMSTTASIIIGTETGLIVPASALKTTGTESYLQVFTPPLASDGGAGGATSSTTPARVPVTIGLTDDTNTIVRSGITSGTQIVTQTVVSSGTPAKASSGAPSILNAGGGRAGAAVARPAGNATFRAIGG